MAEHVTSATGVSTILSTSDAVVVPPAGDPVTSLMSRFSEGEDHARRREIAVSALARLSPDDLRRRAAEETRRRLAGHAEIDAMTLAREVPVAVLADALGLAPVLTVDDPTDEVAVNRMALLLQASDATAGLIGNAVVAAAPRRDRSVDQLLQDTLRTDPPVVHTLRRTTAPIDVEDRTIPANETVVVHLAEADGHVFPFGVGRRPCPGADHALALAAGVLDVVLAGDVAVLDDKIVYDPRPNLRLPQTLPIRRPGPAILPTL